MEFSSLQNLFDYAKRDRYTVTDAEWEESKHPRDESGKRDDHDDSYPEKNYPEYKGQGQKAVDFLMRKRSGQIKGAFNRKEIGDIDIRWGKVIDSEKHTGYGLAHIIDKHGETVAIRRSWNGNKKTWIVTGFEKEKTENSPNPSAADDYTVATSPKPIRGGAEKFGLSTRRQYNTRYGGSQINSGIMADD